MSRSLVARTRRGLAAAPLVLGLLIPNVAAAGPRVTVYLTTKDLRSRLGRGPDLSFAPGAPAGGVAVDPSVRYQTLTAGFGVAMTDSSAYVLDRGLPPDLRDQAMRLLFSPTAPAGAPGAKLRSGR